MSDYVSEKRCHCPHCAEPISIVVDSSAGHQTYIEDCQVCCQPMEITLEVDGLELCNVRVERAG